MYFFLYHYCDLVFVLKSFLVWIAFQKVRETLCSGGQWPTLYKLSSVRKPLLANLWMTFKPLHTPLLLLSLSLRCPFLTTITHILSSLRAKASKRASLRATTWGVLSKEQFAQHKSFCFQPFEWETGGHCGNNLAFSLKNCQDRGVE